MNVRGRHTRAQTLLVVIALLVGSSAAAGVLRAPQTTSAQAALTPVMGRATLSAQQLAAWYSRHSGSRPQIPAFGGHPAGDVAALAQVFIDDGAADGVRGDIAFVQSMLETGWIGFAGSQVPPDAFNYAGIFAFDGRSYVGAPGRETCAHGDTAPSRCMGTPQRGVLTQIELLRSYADASTKNLRGRLLSAPPDRVGAAPYWEYFGGHNCPCGKLIWASADGYGALIVRMYNQALSESGVHTPPTTAKPAPKPTPPPAPCSPPNTRANVTAGTGAWSVAANGAVTVNGHAGFFGDPHRIWLAAPVTGGDSTPTRAGYWLVARDGGVFAYGDARFYGSMGGSRTNKRFVALRRTTDGGGYWIVADDGTVVPFGDAPRVAASSATRLTARVVTLEPTPTAKGYWLVAADGTVAPFGDAKSYGSASHVPSPVVAMQSTVTGKGYWLLTAAGRITAFGDAKAVGDLGACATAFGGATRLLVSSGGNGYYLATGSGRVLAFGDAATLAPATTGTGAVALMGADPLTVTYTARFTDAQYRLLLRSAQHFKLGADATVKAGIGLLALTVARTTKPPPKPGALPGARTHVVSVTFSAAANVATMLPVAKYLGVPGDTVAYSAGLIMEYIAVVQGVRPT